MFLELSTNVNCFSDSFSLEFCQEGKEIVVSSSKYDKITIISPTKLRTYSVSKAFRKKPQDAEFEETDGSVTLQLKENQLYLRHTVCGEHMMAFLTCRLPTATKINVIDESAKNCHEIII